MAPCGVAVAAAGADRKLDRFAQHAEDDRVLAGVVADAESMIADLAVRPLSGRPSLPWRCALCPITPAMISPKSRPCRWGRLP